MLTMSRDVPAPADLGTEIIGVIEGSSIHLDLRLESVMEGVLVTGAVRARVGGECIRCLGDLDEEIQVTLTELYTYPGRRPAEDVDEDEVHELEGDLIDLEPVLRDAVVPALPFQPLCRDDCPGLCSQCGARLGDEPEHHHDVVDPRWSMLQDLALDESQSTKLDDARPRPPSDAQEEN